MGRLMVDDVTHAGHADARGSYLRGVVLLILGAVAFSSAGLFVRLIGRDAATILFWRGLFTIIAVVAFLRWRDGPGLYRQFEAI